MVSLDPIPSLKLTYPLKKDPWKRRFLLETISFRCYVSFWEGSTYCFGWDLKLPNLPLDVLGPGPLEFNKGERGFD